MDYTVKTIEIAGEKFPVKYGMNANRLFCEEVGIDLPAFTDLLSKASKAGAKGQAIPWTITQLLTFIWAGLKDGARAAGVPFRLTIDDVADLYDQDPEIVTKAFTAFGDAQPTATDDGKKKTTASR